MSNGDNTGRKMLKSLNTLYKDRINKWTDAAWEASAEARRNSGTKSEIVSQVDAAKHFGISRGTLIGRDKPFRATSKVNGKEYDIHSQGYGAYKVTPVINYEQADTKPYDPEDPGHERA